MAFGANGGNLEPASGVTAAAFDAGVRTLQRVAGDGLVVKSRALPPVDSVASLAVRREVRGPVVDSRGPLVIELMASDALCAEAGEISTRSVSMAGIAGDGGVRTDEWEAVLVALNKGNFRAPAHHGVARFAVRAHLPAVHVRVTVRASIAGAAEDQAAMAARARNPLMEPFQRERRLSPVVELRNGADGTPGGRGMAVLAPNGEIAVRIGRAPARTVFSGRKHCCEGEHTDTQRADESLRLSD